ncbi:MAG TPA: serine hydrolase domain-containing protein [Blastocatellia bacterium]|nr:serine hydrolase domain-containing protein [Blastocatellia bacterium]
MAFQRPSSVALALILMFATTVAPISGAAQSPSSDLSAPLAAIEKSIEEKRRELGVPGLAVAIVKDDRVIFERGFGSRDVEQNRPVTPETLFPIGSCTKAFTAMAALIGADEKKLALDDSPRKYLPYFKLQDPEADALVTIRDLLRHSSGLDQTDLTWRTGVLTRQEVIKVAGRARPTAKVHERFQYQNVMYSAAGETVAVANKSTWEELMVNLFFKPLGMKSSNTSVPEMQKAADFSSGYLLQKTTATRTPTRVLTNIAPAGAINSNVRDMAQWVRMMLGRGQFEGKRIVSEQGFEELTKKQIAFGPDGYGFGWVIGDWNRHQILWHNGSINGFNSLVALMPDQKLGFVILTNVTVSSLPQTVQETIWTHLVGKPPAPAVEAAAKPSVAPSHEAGRYAVGNFTIEVVFKEGKLRAIAPSQPEYPLTNIGGRKYQLGAPAPAGFYMTFRPIKGSETETEAFLEQPHGNIVLIKQPEPDSAAAVAIYNGPHKELLGRYELDHRFMEIALHQGRIVLIVPGQPAYTLVEKEKDLFGAAELPDAYRMVVKRDSAARVVAVLMKQPEGELEFKRSSNAGPPKIALSVDEVMARVVEAAGGETNLRRHWSMVTVLELELENQGLTGEVTVSARKPNASATSTTLIALGKKIGTTRSYFDGIQGSEESSFSPSTAYQDQQLEDVRIASDFYEPLNWKTLYKEVRIKELSRIENEEVYVVVKTPEKGHPITDYYSARTFLLLRRDRTVSSSMTISATYSDYRTVEGVNFAFQSATQQPGLGRVVAHLVEVQFNVEIPDAAFRAVR